MRGTARAADTQAARALHRLAVARRIRGRAFNLLLWALLVLVLCVWVSTPSISSQSVSNEPQLEQPLDAIAKTARSAATSGSAKPSAVLVLGSGGLLGRLLVNKLRDRGYAVVDVPDASYLDLRYPSALDFFNDTHVSFAFMMAEDNGESGGTMSPEQVAAAKNDFLSRSTNDWFRTRGVRFFHISWYWPNYSGSLARAKSLMHMEQEAVQYGKILRLAPVVAADPLHQSGAFATMVDSCVRTGSAQLSALPTTNCLSGDDAVSAMVDAMERFDSLPPVTDIINEARIKTRDLTAAIAERLPQRCEIRHSMRSRLAVKPKRGKLPSSGRTIRVRSSVAEQLRTSTPGASSTAEADGRPYISVVLSGRNDNYKGSYFIRLYNFVRSFAAAAKSTGLSYEIVFVQYNPDRNILPIGQVLPFTGVRSLGNLKVMTIGRRQGSKKHFLEFYAKNFAARRSAGKFVLFTNSDNIFSPKLLHTLAKKYLNPRIIYRARRVDAKVYSPNADVSTLLEGCHRMAPNSAEEMKAYMKLMRRPFWHASGDFTLISRDRLLSRNGYPEVDSNLHVDSFGLQNFFCPQYPQTMQLVFDEPICHQSHQRRRPKSMDFEDVRRLSCSANSSVLQEFHISESWGAPEQSYELADLGNYLSNAFNPATPYKSYKHHSALGQFSESHSWEGPLSPEFVVDFTGFKTPIGDACGSRENQYLTICAIHRAHLQMGVSRTIGKFPVIDQNYFVNVAIVETVLACTASETAHFAEIGTEFGLWTSYAANALNSARPDCRPRLSVKAVQNTQRFADYRSLNGISEPVQDLSTALNERTHLLIVDMNRIEDRLDKEFLLTSIEASCRVVLLTAPSQKTGMKLLQHLKSDGGW
eukprot:CAMPEP_0198738058 /NCGR_PEP_ID=MMETSP1475-20131203/68180_1 /TAXON_ID= ORGANISM="Unidentified sp., Strain CCMP1999" /NCGR_SAMPLE_ID=MMETSP1475 /ASSEMBLY_ACC=CAM_ASM_001111 /LENGTH=868 /DNA_ID=CAMNT_0044501929 /DNA_START=294 /DNA_END=2897 /DNA_ORIENTATION=+